MIILNTNDNVIDIDTCGRKKQYIENWAGSI